jgi:signal recognition particle GTPase
MLKANATMRRRTALLTAVVLVVVASFHDLTAAAFHHSISISSSSFVPRTTATRRACQPRRIPSSSSSLNMMFDQLSKALADVAKTLGPKQRMTEASMKPALKQVRRALLDADVNVDVADTLIEGVRTRSLGKEVMKGVTAEQQFIKAMYDELLDMMGGGGSSAMLEQQASVPVATLATGTVDKPAVVLLAGLQG